jgi:hypothetical protein
MTYAATWGHITKHWAHHFWPWADTSYCLPPPHIPICCMHVHLVLPFVLPLQAKLVLSPVLPGMWMSSALPAELRNRLEGFCSLWWWCCLSWLFFLEMCCATAGCLALTTVLARLALTTVLVLAVMHQSGVFAYVSTAPWYFVGRPTRQFVRTFGACVAATHQQSLETDNGQGRCDRMG